MPAKTPVVFAWSGGKDSAYGLRVLLGQPQYEVRALLTTLTVETNRVSMSRIPERLLDRQARSLGIPLIKVRLPRSCTDQVYEERMIVALRREEFAGLRHVAFGDLYLEGVRAYREQRLARVGMRAIFPLWGRDTAILAREMIADGFGAITASVDPRVLDSGFAGRPFDDRFLAELPPSVDPCGENGEFHTFVWRAPHFSEPVGWRTVSVRADTDGFVYCDLESAPAIQADPA